MNKAEIRTRMLRRRDEMNERERTEKSRQIAERLESLPLFQHSRVILAYMSFQTEVETRDLMEKWFTDKIFYLPVLIPDQRFLVAPFTAFETLNKNSYGIFEPPLPTRAAERLDFILLPGLAFDRRGNRIGMGKGYYDRFLKNEQNAARVALAFSEQILESVPEETYDERVDWIITENETIDCRQ